MILIRDDNKSFGGICVRGPISKGVYIHFLLINAFSSNLIIVIVGFSRHWLDYQELISNRLY